MPHFCPRRRAADHHPFSGTDTSNSRRPCDCLFRDSNTALVLPPPSITPSDFWPTRPSWQPLCNVCVCVCVCMCVCERKEFLEFILSEENINILKSMSAAMKGGRIRMVASFIFSSEKWIRKKSFLLFCWLDVTSVQYYSELRSCCRGATYGLPWCHQLIKWNTNTTQKQTLCSSYSGKLYLCQWSVMSKNIKHEKINHNRHKWQSSLVHHL